jgi:hypothetical protein
VDLPLEIAVGRKRDMAAVPAGKEPPHLRIIRESSGIGLN